MIFVQVFVQCGVEWSCILFAAGNL